MQLGSNEFGRIFFVQRQYTAPGYGFYQVFLNRVNPEFIIFQNRSANRDMEGFYNMPTRGGAYNAMPTQNLVDAFPMKNGKAISDASSGYDPNNPYKNRDPRFEYSIVYNESMYYLASANAQRQVLTYENAPSDGFTQAGQTTGYYSRKMCDANISANSSFNSNRGWSLMRYAEVLLNYAEAINETGKTDLAYAPLIALRDRAGIAAGMTNCMV
jgi:hypothetical protein